MIKILKFKEIFNNGALFHIANTTFFGFEKYALHSHDFHEFIIVEEGILKHTINNHIEELKTHTLYLIKPSDIHSISNSSRSEKVKIINFAVMNSAFYKSIKYLDIDKSNIANKTIIPTELWASFKYAIVELNNLQNSNKNNKKFIDILTKNLINSLLIRLSINTKKAENNVPLWLITAREKMLESNNIQQGLSKFISVSNRTQEHLNRSMKKYYGITPTIFINELRLQYASRLLVSTNFNIESIMYKSGFENMSHFSRLFKKYFNTTPSKFRFKSNMIYNNLH